MSYKVAISEEQRKIIAAALEYAVLKYGEEWKHSAEASVLVEMLAGLPQIEAQNPGILHGFAL